MTARKIPYQFQNAQGRSRAQNGAVMVKMTEELTPGGVATAVVLLSDEQFVGSLSWTPIETAMEIEVIDIIGTTQLDVDTRILVQWNHSFGGWVPLTPTAPGSSNLFIQAPVGGIPARVGTLLGLATCNIWSLGGTSRTISDTGDDIEVLNWGVTAACATGDRYGWASYYDGAWWIVSEDCADVSQSQLLTLTDGRSDGPGTPLSEETPSGVMVFYEQDAVFGDIEDLQVTGDPPPFYP